MKKGKRVICVLLGFLLVFSIFPASVFAEASDWDPLTDPDDVLGDLVGSKTSSASTTITVGNEGYLRTMPTLTSGYTTYNAMAYCGAQAVSSNPDIASLKEIRIGKWQGGTYDNWDCLEIVVTPKRAGTVRFTINYYYTFSQHATPFNNPNAQWYYATLYYTVNVNEPENQKYTVTYTDGVDGEVVFADQVYSDLLSGTDTPDFVGTPEREGYVFAGWNPAVAETVTGSATYTATWKEDKNNNGQADEDEAKYTVTYTDGVDGEAVFADQVYDNLLSGTDTPDFVGTPEREGYVFAGWNPAVAETVTGSVTYTATWNRLPSEGETLPPDNPNDDVETIPDQDENSNVTAPDTGDYTVTWISFTLILAASVLLLLVKIRSNKAK